MELEKIKNNIIKKLNGVKVEENNLMDCFCNIDEEMKTFSPTQWLYNFTELEIPEQYYDSVYYVPIEKDNQYTEFVLRGHTVSSTGVLIFLGTENGKEADYVCSIFPFGFSFVEQNRIMTKLLNKE